MKITVLGCGSSGGMPLIGNVWGACDPKNPRNNRRRASIMVEDDDTTILVDASPDLRQQLLDTNTQKITAVLFTHAHADHSHGIDELRGMNWLMQKPVEIYADAGTMAELESRFSYIFQGKDDSKGYYKPSVRPNIIDAPFSISRIAVKPFTQDHGYGKSFGFRFNDFAYSTDAKALDETAFAALKGVKVWVVDCVREEPHPTHSHLAQTLEWIARVKPERAYLTHLGHTLDYEKLAAKCPPGVWPAHDGLVIEC